ncbi:carbon-nitrogen hydrolase family protein [Salinispira pacifica]
MAQIRVDPGSPVDNLARAQAAIAEAATRACDICVLPECMDLGWASQEARRFARPIPGEYSEVLCSAAREHRIFVVAGLTEAAGEEVYNAAVLIAPDGRILSVTRKINVGAFGVYHVGDTLRVVQTSIGAIGMTIGADTLPPSFRFVQELANRGAQIVVSPCAWPVEPDALIRNVPDPGADAAGLWHGFYAPLARRYGIAVVGVGSVGPIGNAGPWSGYSCVGGSVAIGPEGQLLARGPIGAEAEAVVVVSIPECSIRAVIREPLQIS